MQALFDGGLVSLDTELEVWGRGGCSPALLAAASLQPAVLADLLERGGQCSGTGLATLAGAVGPNRWNVC